MAAERGGMMFRRILQCLLVFTLLSSILTGCGYEETKEYELIYIRRYVETEEYGVFSKKTDYEWYIECVCKAGEETVIVKDNEEFVRIHISDENKVVMKEGSMSPDIYITLEKYNELYEVEVE